MKALPENPFSRLSISDYGRRLRRGEISAERATIDLLGRIDALNPKLGAYTFVAPDQALAAARAVDALVHAGTDLGPLMGVPVAVKDLFYVEDMPLTAGSRLDVSDIVRAEGPFVRALKGSGAIILGKTWTSEFALGGINSIQRVPWNPSNPNEHLTPGGSSGGSAAAMAAGLCAFALGSDTGGSVRMPAALCGVVGHKFSSTAFALDGIFPLSPTLDSIGTFTASVEDATLVWRAMAGTPGIPAASLEGLRLGKPEEVFYEDLDIEVQGRVDNALERLARAGVKIIPVEVPEVAEFETVFGRIVPIELIAILGRARVEQNREIFDPVVQARFAAALDPPPGEYLQARARQTGLRDAVKGKMRGLDAWITPTTPLLPGPLSAYAALDAALAWNRRALRNTRPGNVFDQCGISLPLPSSEGAPPVGLQLCCPAGHDARLLSIAGALAAVINSPE